MGRDYAIVWLGLKYALTNPEELERAKNQSHELIGTALQSGLGWYCDSFDVDDAESEIWFLLIGKNLGILGFKEGVTQLEVKPSEAVRELHEMIQRLGTAGITEEPAIHILFHVDFE